MDQGWAICDSCHLRVGTQCHRQVPYAKYFNFTHIAQKILLKKGIIERYKSLSVILLIWQTIVCSLSFYNTNQFHSVFKILPVVLSILASYFYKRRLE